MVDRVGLMLAIAEGIRSARRGSGSRYAAVAITQVRKSSLTASQFNPFHSQHLPHLVNLGPSNRP